MLRMVFAALMLVLVSGGSHYYLYRRLVVSTDLAARWHRTGRVMVWVLGAGTPLALVLSLLFPSGVMRALLYPFFVWMGGLFLLTLLFGGYDLGRFGVWAWRRLARREAPPNPGRRKFLARVAAGTVTGTAFAAGAFGIHQALGRLVVKEVSVTLDRLPPAFDGFTIAQITDLHLGPMRGRDWMATVVRRVNAIKADLIAVTGDLVDGSVESLQQDVAPLAELKAPHGVFFVTGNHEYYSGAPEWVAHLTKMGIRVLRNERVVIERGGAQVDLAGVDDFRAEGLAPGHRHDVRRAVAGRDPKRELILLAHQPRSIFDAARAGVGLMLCGHTHGGQIFPIHLISRLVNVYVRGLHKHDKTWIYVSSGTGFWGPPVRLLSDAEITRVVLRARRG